MPEARNMKVTVIGVYPVAGAPEPCHLIELEVEGVGEFAVGSITQPAPTQPEANWQVPYDEYCLAPDGHSGEPLGFAPMDLRGHVRLAFYFHYLSPSEPLRTPVGLVTLPPVTPMPDRLKFMKYDPPC
jgi:hypothetical protein